MLIADTKLGLNTFIKYNKNNKYIITKDIRINLKKNKPIISQKAIMYKGITCF
jgi:hypothetical protein